MHNHIGNTFFRDLIRRKSIQYDGAASRTEKGVVISQVSSILSNRGCRFLIYSQESELWFRMDEKQANKKIAQSLRDHKKKKKHTVVPSGHLPHKRALPPSSWKFNYSRTYDTCYGADSKIKGDDKKEGNEDNVFDSDYDYGNTSAPVLPSGGSPKCNSAKVPLEQDNLLRFGNFQPLPTVGARVVMLRRHSLEGDCDYYRSEI